MSNISTYDVVVVGGGPSGLVVGAELARSGARVAILEKRTGGPVTRAGTLLPRPLELFDARGIADRFVRRTCEVNQHPFTTEHIWAGMHPVDWTDLDSRFGFTLFLAQSETEEILGQWASESGAEIMLGYEVRSVTDHGDRVTVHVTLESGELVDLEAAYVVGADGARGVVRKSVHIPMEGFPETFTGVATICEMPFPFPGGFLSVTNERGWLLAFPFGADVTRMGFVHAEGCKTARDVPVTVEEVARCVSDILGEPLEIPSITEALRYTNARRMANVFHKGRVLLVGESLRYHYPASGVGMNYCIQDAFNLGWKLAAVVTHRADPALLQTYEAERRPVCEALMDSVDAQVAIQFNFSREGQMFLNRFQKTLIEGTDVTKHLWAELQGLEQPYDMGPDAHHAAGRVAPDFDILLRDGTSIRLYEALREDGILVLDLAPVPSLDAELIGKAGGNVLAGHPVRKPKVLGAATAVVVRPDAYIAWANDGGADSSAVAAAVAACYAR